MWKTVSPDSKPPPPGWRHKFDYWHYFFLTHVGSVSQQNMFGNSSYFSDSVRTSPSTSEQWYSAGIPVIKVSTLNTVQYRAERDSLWNPFKFWALAPCGLLLMKFFLFCLIRTYITHVVVMLLSCHMKYEMSFTLTRVKYWVKWLMVLYVLLHGAKNRLVVCSTWGLKMSIIFLVFSLPLEGYTSCHPLRKCLVIRPRARLKVYTSLWSPLFP